ncbi:hypothetical protein V2J09_023481 [Rumex salicifolius]
MGNCFTGDDKSPENSAHPPPPEEVAGDVVSEYNCNPRSMASANSSILNSTVMDPKLVSAGDVVSKYNYNPRSTASANSSPLNTTVMDPKLVSLLDFFKQLERRKKELFSEVIPVHGDEIMDVFRKIRKDEERRGRPGFQFILKRNHSAGAAGAVARGIDLSGGDIKLERFKVKTLDVGDPPPPPVGGGKGGGGKK